MGAAKVLVSCVLACLCLAPLTAWADEANAWNPSGAGRGPGARGWWQASWDSDLRLAVLFGGSASTYMSDTWTYDATRRAWALKRPHPDLEGPCRRDGHNLVYSAKTKRHWLFNGQVYSNMQPGCEAKQQGWAYDAASNTWERRTITDFKRRFGGALAADERTGHLYMFGGSEVNPGNQLYRIELYDTPNAEGHWGRCIRLKPAGPVPPPGINIEGAFVYVPDAGVFVFAGGKGDRWGTWVYDPAQGASGEWRRMDRPGTAQPEGRENHAMIYDTVHRVVILHGGRNATSTIGDTWVYSLQRNEWIDLTAPPLSVPLVPAKFHTLVFDGQAVHLLPTATPGRDAQVFRYNPSAPPATRTGASRANEPAAKPGGDAPTSAAPAASRAPEAGPQRAADPVKPPGAASVPAAAPGGAARPAPEAASPRAEDAVKPPAPTPRARAGGASAASSPALAQGQAPAASPTPGTPRSSLPLRTWVARELPKSKDAPCWGGCKHLRLEHNPDDGLIYVMGGDHLGTGGGFFDSGRNEMYTYSVARNEWKLIQPYCRQDGGEQASGPDEVGWTYDRLRHLFWMVPGYMWTKAGTQCPQAKMVHGKIMTFDPSTARWAVPGIGTPPRAAPGGWTTQAFHDDKTDTIIALYWDGSWGTTAAILDVKSKQWSYAKLAGHKARVTDTLPAFDRQGRALYFIPESQDRMLRYDLDTKSVEDLGPTPPAGYKVERMPVWDSVNRVVLFPASEVESRNITLHVYDPRRKEWTTDPMATDPPGGVVRARHAVFDPVENVLMVMGLNSRAWLYRYGVPGESGK